MKNVINNVLDRLAIIEHFNDRIFENNMRTNYSEEMKQDTRNYAMAIEKQIELARIFIHDEKASTLGMAEKIHRGKYGR